MPSRDINEVMKDHGDDLMAIEGVVGVAIGELEDKRPYFMVMIAADSDELRRQVPETLEGHPVRIVVTGEIKPLSSD